MIHTVLAPKKSQYTIFFYLFLFGFCLLNINNISAQENQDYLSEKFENYATLPREITYAHLNKSTLIKGEMLGFSIYVFDKFDKGPSTGTTNMYCVVSDSTDQIIKKKLIKMESGLAHNVFNIDSTFTSGNYKFIAYTNYMLNFNEPNHFEAAFTVIDPEIESEINNVAYEAIYDIQVLPEGGHLIEDTQNTVAIIVKDNKGNGLKNKTGQIVDNNNIVVSNFKLDLMGIAKTILFPKKNESYKVIIPIESENEIQLNLPKAEEIGFNMSLSELRETIILTFRTNEVSLPLISGKDYKLSIHNGSKLVTSGISFNDKKEFSKVVKKEMLFPGVNVLTVFDSKDNPILERLFFNHNGVEKATLNSSQEIKKIGDSLAIIFTFKDVLDESKIQNISLSVLPNGTKSYNFNSTILSKLYLEPYIKGTIENVDYYFSASSPKLRYDLDNLLLSQGWSSYDWTRIFNAPPIVTRPFEFGITTVANVNDKDKNGTYISVPLKENTSEIFVLGEGDTAFNQKGLFPLDGETYKISKTGQKDAKKPNLYVTFHPSEFPENTLEPYIKSEPNNEALSFVSSSNVIRKNAFNSNGVEKLDEVVVLANKEKTKLERIESKYFGDVDIISGAMKEGSMTVAMYLLTKGYNARESLGQLSITVRNPATPNNNIPVVYLDGTILSDFNVLANFRMADIDYVVIDKMGAAEGVRGVNGVIRIFTDPLATFRSNRKDVVSEHEFPLTFSSEKKYYTPKYQVYNSTFYKQYGIIEWIPNIKANDDGSISFKILDTGLNIIDFYFEGIINDKIFISETKTIELN